MSESRWSEPGPNGVSWCQGSAVAYDRDEPRPCGYIVPNADGTYWAQRYAWYQTSVTIGTWYVKTQDSMSRDDAMRWVEEYKSLMINEAPSKDREGK
jgi:hypothetical protein